MRRGVLAELTAEAGDVSGLVGYLEPHRGHTAYRARLAEGRSIGSGMVEGACKTAIGLRLKQTGGRWKVRRLERIAALCCLHYGDLFATYCEEGGRDSDEIPLPHPGLNSVKYFAGESSSSRLPCRVRGRRPQAGESD